MAMAAPDVPEQPIPNVRVQPTATLETFGGGAGLEQEGQAIQQIAASGGEIGAFEKIKADQAAYEEAANKLTEHSSQVASEALHAQGVNSIPAHDAAIAAIRKKANEIAGTLHGEQQIGAFNKYAYNLDSEVNRQLGAHVSVEMEKHYDKTADAFIKNTTEFAAANYGDPMTRQRSLQSIDTTLDGYAQRKGMDGEETKLMRSNVHSNFHEQTIDMMLNDPKTAPMANQYYQENKADINLATRERLDKTIGEGDTRYGAQSAVQSIIQKHPDSESEALKAADKIDDADQRDMARKMITARFTQDRQALKNDQDTLFMQTAKSIDQKGLTDSIDIRNAIPPATWNKLREDQRTALEKRGAETVTSISKWMDFKEAVKDGSVSQISRADLESKYLPYMSAADKKTVSDEWSAGQKKGPQLLKDQSVAQSIDQSLSTAGMINPNSKQRGRGDETILKQVQDNVHRDIVMFESTQNRSPKPDEIQSIVDKRTIEAIGNKPAGFFSRFSSAPATPFEAIPEKAKEQAAQLGRSGGWVPTRRNIEKAYQLHREGKTDDEISKALK